MTTSGDKRRGRRPALEPNERRRLAARIAKMVLVDRLEQKDILQQLTKSEPGMAHIDASTVSRLYRYALDSGIVRVHIDEVPDGVLLSAGTTCTVVIAPSS